jgi:hypothetical protein
MSFRHPSLLIALALAATVAVAQPAPPAQPPASIDAIPQELDSLVSEPATHASFTFDRSMLSAAEALIDDGTGNVRRAAAGISSITVQTFHYQRPAFYDPEAMALVIATCNAAGWKHLVNANATPAASAQPIVPVTDLWLHFSGSEISDVAVLVRAPRTMNLIQVSGALRPLDLLHLSGHFGIPKVDPSAVMVPPHPAANAQPGSSVATS